MTTPNSVLIEKDNNIILQVPSIANHHDHHGGKPVKVKEINIFNCFEEDEKYIGDATTELEARRIEKLLSLPPPVISNDFKSPVRVGINLLSVDTVDDKTNTFHANFLFHLKFVTDGKGFRPWIQFKNAINIEEIENKGALRYDTTTITEKTVIMETYNLSGTFATTLDLRDFPFDMQNLCMILVSNPTNVVSLTYLGPKSIKANFEYHVLAEWRTPRLADGTALSYFTFPPADANLSAMGVSYSNCLFYVMVARKEWAVLNSVFLPNSSLSAAAFVVFALHPNSAVGDRLGIVFTLLLTLFANQFVTKERLPNLDYRTLVDKYLLASQAFLYLVGAENALVHGILSDDDALCEYWDKIGLAVAAGFFVFYHLYFTFRSLSLIHKRESRIRDGYDKAAKCRTPVS